VDTKPLHPLSAVVAACGLGGLVEGTIRTGDSEISVETTEALKMLGYIE
jgi:hypothetical protein